MEALGLSEGETLEVRASGSIAVKCFARKQSDKNIGNATNVIRIDRLERTKLGISIGDMIIARRS